MNCRLYGPKQGPSCFFAPSDASVRVNTQLWVADMYGFPATFRWVQVKVGGRKCQGLVPSEYVQPPRAKVQALLNPLFATMTAQMHRCAVHQSSQCPSNCIAQPQRAAKCVLCSRTTCVQGTRVICIGVRCSRWRALVAHFAQMCLLHPRKYISLCIKQNNSFFAISGCSCIAVNCMYGHGSLACNWLRCACQRMGQFYSTHQPKAIWEWNTVHCEPVVAHSSRAVQTICGICAIVHDRRKASEIRLSPANQACTSCFEKTTGVCCIQGNTFLYVLRGTVRFSQFQVVPTLL